MEIDICDENGEIEKTNITEGVDGLKKTEKIQTPAVSDQEIFRNFKCSIKSCKNCSEYLPKNNPNDC